MILYLSCRRSTSTVHYPLYSIHYRVRNERKLMIRTLMRSSDIDELERTLLDRNDWTSLQVHGVKVDRRWLEIVNSY